MLVAFSRENGLCLAVPFSLLGPSEPSRGEPLTRAVEARDGGMLVRDDEREGSAPSGRTSAV